MVGLSYVPGLRSIRTFSHVSDEHTLSSLMRLINTKHHSTIKVSTEFEKVWFWKVQVT